ncbi:hypothetical protein [Marisediminicola senii]|uniref:hypothetical protein n=1 Tax=Marisediminicola senii TaxID=2711233 RepID=UPI0013EBDBC1|nr:hypothetical protein [Marisediminicola senii]
MTDQTSTAGAAAPDARPTPGEKLAAASLWLPVVAISVTAALWFDRLPGTLPRQWNGSEVTSTWPTTLTIGATGSFALLGAVVGTIALATAAADIRRVTMLGAGFIAGLSAGLWLVIAGLVVATGSPEPDAGAWSLLALAAGAYGLIPYALSPRRTRDHPLPNSGPPLTLGENETGAWFTTVRLPLFAWFSAVAVIAAVVAGVVAVTAATPGASAASITLILTAVIGLAFASLRVSVDRRGLRVVSTLLRVPIKRIALGSVDSARTGTISPREWGGWGYRVLPGRSAIVLAGGPGIVVQQHNGTTFAVTVPEPELPAALLTALAKR